MANNLLQSWLALQSSDFTLKGPLFITLFKGSKRLVGCDINVGTGLPSKKKKNVGTGHAY